MSIASATPITIREKRSINLVNPTTEDLKKAVKELSSLMGYEKLFPYQKILVKFMDEVKVRVDSRNVKKMREMKVKFFENNGRLCYTFHSRSGYPITYINYDRIYSMTIFGPETDSEKAKKVQSFLNKFHPNVWEDMKERIKSDPSYFEGYYTDTRTINISKNFPRYVMDELKKAFENKTPYHYKKYGDRRDLSVDVEIGANGKLRAWYSNEYAGCGNGSYYILINPTTAALKEDD